MWIVIHVERLKKKKKKNQSSANIGEIDVSIITSDSDNDFSLQPWLQRETTVLCEVSNFR